ncbi:MAG: YfhO family protein [Pirellulales bacterium]|nr:YfhO family protein [Pirellulales bacterium]
MTFGPNRRCAERQLAAWTVLCALALFAVLSLPFYLGQVYTADDLAAFHLPLRAFYATCLARGVDFAWLPDVFNGYYAHGEGQGGFYHPLHLFVYRWLPLRAAFCWEVLASYPLICVGTFALLRRQALPRSAAWFGGVLAAASGFSLLHLMHINALAVLAHTPWLLWADEIRLRTHQRRTAARCELAIALLTGSQLLLGYPQYVWMSLVAEGAYLAWRSRALRVGWRPLLWIAGAKLLGLGLAAIQLLPTLEMLQHSTRETVARDFAGWGSLQPANLVQLVAPYALANRVVGGNTHELGLYLGSVPLTLIVWLVAARPRMSAARRRLAWAAGLMAVVALLFACGEYAGLYRWQTWLPVVGKFRFPCRYLALVHLSIAVLAAVALAALAKQPQLHTAQIERGRRALALLPLAAIVAATAIALVFPREQQAAWPLMLVGPLLLAIAALLIERAACLAPWALPGLIAFGFVDLGVYGLSYSVWPHHGPLPAAYAERDLPPSLASERVVLDLAPFNRPAQHRGNQAALDGYQRVDGYAGLQPARRLDYTRSKTLRVAGVGWASALAATRVTDLTPDPTTGAGGVHLANPLPRCRLVSRVLVTRDPARDLEAIDPAETALVDRPVELDAAAPGCVAMADEQPGRVRLLTDAPGRQLLVVADSFDAGWQAAIDGQPCPVVRAYGDFLACVVPPGIHQVEFTFRPRSLRQGAIVSAVTLLATLALFLGRACLVPVDCKAKRIVSKTLPTEPMP